MVAPKPTPQATSIQPAAQIKHETHFGQTDIIPLKVVCRRGRLRQALPLNYHGEYEFHLIKRGEGSYFIKDRFYPFRKNSFFMIQPKAKHRLVSAPDAFTERITLFCAPAMIDLRQRRLLAVDCPCHMALSEMEATIIETALMRISQEKRTQEPYWRHIVRGELRNFLYLVKRVGIRHDPLPPANPLVRQLADYLEINFAKPLTVEALARTFGYSAHYLMHMFKRHAGVSVKQYILQRRIVEAKLFLEQQPAIKTDAIARQVGFRQFGLFNRCFKRIAGLTPTAYRQLFSQPIRH